ncbi:Aspartate-semialdehyde dehydrogenase [Geodia barretti]|uniref:aspartate-semialdehyde dehydrogenase n=1 Tax=Geodia barretti TaxID=519541 RepID=A0AA35W4X1_GEOBA|nr:Aspartate-semialdehyde dehydrogenase [Geodia barretti]
MNLAIVGATGAVGQVTLRLIEARYPQHRNLKLLASKRSAGRKMNVNGKTFVVEETTDDSFDDVDIAFISVSTEASRRFGPVAARAGAMVIDDSSAFRMEQAVPLVVPEVNGSDLLWHDGIVSIPNCSTTPLVMVAHPLRQASPIRRIVADTYQSVSGAGGAAMDELREQTRTVMHGGPAEPNAQPQRIAFNVFPQIDGFNETGYTVEEQKMIDESRKILHAPDIALSATCVRVPVLVSHCVAAHLEFEQPVSAGEARELLSQMPGVTVQDDPAASVYPMPVSAAGCDDVFVGRIRKDASHPNGLAMWVVTDNLVKGAALNALQIAEEAVALGAVHGQRR